MSSKPRVRPLRITEAPNGSIGGGPSYLVQDPNGLASAPAVVTLPTLCLIELCDGTRDIEQILAEFSRTTGLTAPREMLEGLLAQLQEFGLLDDASSRGRLAELNPRPTRHAGGGYPGEPQALRDYLTAMVGPAVGLEEEVDSQARCLASVLPHIDFHRGSPTYGTGYRSLRKSLLAKEEPLTVIVLGICHFQTRHPFILTRADFATPLGPVPTDLDLVGRLARNLPYDPFEDEYHHLGEHSVEFHAVMLRHLIPDSERLSLVPVLCGSVYPAILSGGRPEELLGYREFLENLESVLREAGRPHLLASVDLAHLGSDFGEAPVGSEGLERLRSLDLESLSHLENGDADRFFETHIADRGGRNYCGTPAIYAALRLYPERFTLHEYRQCTPEDLSSCVSICAATLGAQG